MEVQKYVGKKVFSERLDFHQKIPSLLFGNYDAKNGDSGDGYKIRDSLKTNCKRKAKAEFIGSPF